MSRRAVVSRRIRRSASAWALPRPSATASAKFANTTVNQSQTVTFAVNQIGTPELPPNRSRSRTRVVRTLPTSTTNITGFFATCRGVSLRKLSTTAGPSSSRSKMEGAFARVDVVISVHLSSRGEEVLDDRPEAERGEERQRADDQHDADEQPGEQRAVRWGTCRDPRARPSCPASSRAIASAGMIIRKRPISIVIPSVVFHQGVFASSPRTPSRCCPRRSRTRTGSRTGRAARRCSATATP